MNEKQYNWVVAKGLDFNQFFTLLLWDKKTLEDSKITGWKFLLEKKGYLDSNKQITAEGEELIQEYNEIEKEKVVTSFNLGVWCEQVVESLQNELVSLGFKKNLKGFGGVPFLPTKVELKSHLERFWKAGYSDYKDYDKIHKCLLEHIKECVKKNSFAPSLKYFVYKSGSHNTTYLAGSYDNYEEEVEIKQERIKTKDLF
jgi:hypothetical protein